MLYIRKRLKCRFYTFSLLSLGMLGFVLPVGDAYAQVPNNSIDQIIFPFRNLLFLTGSVQDLAVTLFFSLLTIEMIVSGISLFWSGSDFNAFGKWIVERILIIGIAVYIFDNGAWIGSVIIWSFDRVGIVAGGISPTPTAVIEKGVMMATELVENVSWWDGAKGIPILMTALLLMMIFALVGANMVVMLCELYVLAVLGIVLLGFAGSSWTRDYALSYFRYMIGLGFKLATMQVLVGLGLTVINGYLLNLGGEDLRNSSLFMLIATMLVFWALTNSLPGAAADMVQGRIGGGFGGVGTAGVQAATTVRGAAQMMSGAASTIAGAAKSMANTAGAAASAAKVAQQGGATGAAVISGAAATMASAAKQEAGAAIRGVGSAGQAAGVSGPGSQRMSASQRVNANVKSRLTK